MVLVLVQGREKEFTALKEERERQDNGFFWW